MKLTARRALCLVLLSALGLSCSKPAQKEATPPPPTAAQLFADFERERTADHPGQALSIARDLISTFGGTPEAERAARQIQQLEAAVKVAEAAEQARAAKAAAEEEAHRLAIKWTYFSSEDPMSNRRAKMASISSENMVEFSFPYQGAQHATLMLRDHPTYGRDVILRIERGQILCRSYEDCQIRVRFDEGAARIWNAVGPEDNSSTSIFLRDEAAFVQRLRSSKIVRLQVPIYEEGAPVFEFQVGGFDYGRYRNAE